MESISAERTFRRILAAISLSSEGPGVLRAAARIARAFDGFVAAAHADPEAALEEVRGRRAHLASALRALVDACPAAERVTSVALLHGEPSQAIVSYARSEGFDLIALGGGEHGRAERLRPGRTAMAILRHPPCPVLCVDPRHPLEDRSRTILFAAAFHDGEERIGELALDLARHLEAKLLVVHVFSPAATQPRAAACAAVAEVERRLDALRSLLAARGRPQDVIAHHVPRAEAALGILSAAADARADLIVLGGTPPGRTGETVLNRAVCSVMVVPP